MVKLNKPMSKQLKPYFSEHFRCDNCQKKFRWTTAYAPDSSLEETYCVKCVKSEVGFCSFHNKGKQGKCFNSLFNKKKQLCRPHYYQVWKRLNKKQTLPEVNQHDKRISGRTRQLNLKVSEETYWRLKESALKNKCLMTEVLERMLENKDERKICKNS
jgi:hypothetical protein